LNHGFIGDDSRHTPQGIDFSDNLPFRHTAHCGITGHLRDGIHVHGDQENTGAHSSSSGCRLTTGMPGPHNNYIVFFKH
jgi:hypothetical protein